MGLLCASFRSSATANWPISELAVRKSLVLLGSTREADFRSVRSPCIGNQAPAHVRALPFSRRPTVLREVPSDSLRPARHDAD
jgi:hypothetical protein